MPGSVLSAGDSELDKTWPLPSNSGLMEEMDEKAPVAVHLVSDVRKVSFPGQPAKNWLAGTFCPASV